MRRVLSLVALCCLVCCSGAYSAPPMSKQACLERIHAIINKHKVSVGVAVIQPDTRDTLLVNAEKHFPMQSVFKFHLALGILHDIEQGKYALTDSMLMRKSDMHPDWWSPLREKYGERDVVLPLDEILRATVSSSDNNGCDFLFAKLGGPQVLHDYLHRSGIRDVAVVINEAIMQAHWDRQYENWTTASAAVQTLLLTFHNKTLLSAKNTDYLWNVMAGTTTGTNKLKALLPAGTVVAHKTGWSGAKNGLTAASNDIGIIELPNKQRIAIAVLVGESRENEDTNCRIIAEISKAVWDYYTMR